MIQEDFQVQAFRFLQGAEPVYMLVLTPQQLSRISSVHLIGRNDDDELVGYQRPEQRRHIEDILNYLNGPSPIFLNALILAIPPSVSVLETGDANRVILSFPYFDEGDTRCWLIDGQQRTAALKRCNKQDFPVPVTAIPAATVELLREQFVRINNSKPLPRGLIAELLPSVGTPVNTKMDQLRIASMLCDRLNQDPLSPFYRRIKRPTHKAKSAVITDSAVIKGFSCNLFHPNGCLSNYWDPTTGTVAIDPCLEELNAYWGGVQDAFPEAWGLSPKESRLTHGAGIFALSKLMDRITPNYRTGESKRYQAGDRLRRLRPYCAWTSGKWEILGGVAWNAVQNTAQDLDRLAVALTQQLYRDEVRHS